LMADASVSTKHGNDNGNGWKITTTTYGGGFLVDVSNLGDASAMVSVSPTIYVTALTATNAGCVSDMIHDDTTTYNSSANPGNEDLFTPNPLPYDPVGILAVNYFAQISKSSAAGKQARITGKGSSGTHFQSSAISPTTSFINYQFQQNTDPDTALAWTKAGFAASKLGYLVES